MDYKLELKQIVAFPRCRIYRQFVNTLIDDRSIRTCGGSGLFYFISLCALANYQTSYQKYGGIRYIVFPGEWICSLVDLLPRLRVQTRRQALNILQRLEDQHWIEYSLLGRGKLVKFKIVDWEKSNRIIEANAPCVKDTGFFFCAVAQAYECVGFDRCSEMDILLDLWINAIYNDEQVQGSELGPVVYFRNGSGSPLTNYRELATRWGISKTSVARLMKKLESLGYLRLMSFPAHCGTAIYLNGYLSTMFGVSDVMVDKDEVALALDITLSLPAKKNQEDSLPVSEEQMSVPQACASVPKPVLFATIRKVAKILTAQGFSCAGCPHALYRLSPLSDCTEGLFLLTIESCGEEKRFTLRLTRSAQKFDGMGKGGFDYE